MTGLRGVREKVCRKDPVLNLDQMIEKEASWTALESARLERQVEAPLRRCARRRKIVANKERCVNGVE